MGCFSFLCKKSGKPALSTSFSGSPCYLFLLKDGKVIETMYGNYDSYGRVFKGKGEDSFEWQMDWHDVCALMFDYDSRYGGRPRNNGNGIAMILAEHFDGELPTTASEGDPNQGWGGEDEENLMGDCSSDKFAWVEHPYHFVAVKEE